MSGPKILAHQAKMDKILAREKAKSYLQECADKANAAGLTEDEVAAEIENYYNAIRSIERLKKMLGVSPLRSI